MLHWTAETLGYDHTDLHGWNIEAPFLFLAVGI